jgi:O-antigen/teichoic acid export membrane protein
MATITEPETQTPADGRPATAPPLSLPASFSWSLAGNVVYAACQWAMLVVLAKLGSTEAVGRFSLGLAVTAPVILLAGLQLRTVQATDHRDRFRFGDYLGLRLLTTALALAAVGLIVAAAGYGRETALVVLAVGLGKAFEAVADVYYGLFQQRERMERVARALMLQGVLGLAALAVLLHLTGSLVWATAGWAAAAALALTAYTLPAARALARADALRPRWEPRALGRLAWLALPLGVVMMLVSLNTNLPRYFIEGERGERELGIFSAIAYLMAAGNTVVAALGQAVSPRLAKHFAAGDRRAFAALLGKLVGVAVLVGAAGVAVALAAGRPLLTLLYRPEYADHESLLLWVMAASGLGYVASFLGYGMSAARYFRAQLPLFAAVALVTAAACAVLVPRFGLVGGAVACLVAAAVQVVGSGAVLAHALSRRAEVTP